MRPQACTGERNRRVSNFRLLYSQLGTEAAKFMTKKRITMRNLGSHVRLKHPGRHAFACGMFGACAEALLGPTAPPQSVVPMETEAPRATIESFTRWELPVARERATLKTPAEHRSGDETVTVRGEGDGVPAAAALVEGIVKALRSHGRPAVKALLALCLAEQRHRADAVRAGAVDALLEALPNLSDSSAERALATLDLLCTVAEGRVALRDHALAVPLLLEMIFKVSDRGTECAVSALCGVCGCEGALDAQETALQSGALMQLLLLIQSDCTSRAKRKALHLLKLLQKA